MKPNKKQIIIVLLVIALVNIILNYNFFITRVSNKKEQVYDYSNQETSKYEINNITKAFDILYISFDESPEKITIEYKNQDLTNYNHFNQPYNNDTTGKKELYVYKSLGSDITDLRVKIDDGKINKIILNPKVKYKLYLYKTFMISLILLILISISKYKEKLDLKNKYQKIMTIIIITTLLILSFSFMTTHYKKENNLLYTLYTDSIIDKKLDLDYSIDEGLLNIENPYDTSTRNYRFLWDASYYKGKYYCYFGILPIITILAPLKLLSGMYLSVSYISFLYSILGIICSYLLYKNIIKKHYPKIEYRMFIMSFVYIILGSKLFWCMHRCDYYEMASIGAFANIVLGLNLVLFNKKNSIVRDIFGYIFLALSVLCRPTSLFLFLLTIPKTIEKKKKHVLKVKNILSIILPYTIVGIIVMYMNYIRFDSIFEFGIKYQLTTSNFIHNHFSILRVLIGFVHFFFEPFQIRLFPFTITGIKCNYPIISDFAIGETGGGIIFTSIIGLIIFFYPKIIKYIKDKTFKIYLLISLIIAIVLLSLSAGSIGMVGRYMFDFNYLFYFIIVILSLTLIEKDKSTILPKIIYIGMILSIIVNYCISLTNII